MKCTVEFDNIEQATAAVNAVRQGFGAQPAAPAPGYNAPAPAAPQPAYNPAPPPPPPQVYAAPAPAAPQQPAPMPAPAPQPQAGGGITQAQVASAAQGYAQRHTPKAAKAKLAEFGITKISEADPSVYPQLLQALSV